MITVQIDSFEECIPELRPLFQVHHVELGLYKDLMPLDPEYGEYVRREQEGSLFLTTARRNGTLVAYYVAIIRPGFHYHSTLTGTADIYYVVPEMRGRGLALPLFRHVEQELRRRGAQIWYSGGKVHNPLGTFKLHKLLGFRPADMYCVKWIGGAT